MEIDCLIRYTRKEIFTTSSLCCEHKCLHEVNFSKAIKLDSVSEKL